MTFPRLRLRDEVAGLLDLPWELPLERVAGDGPRVPRARRSARRGTSSGSSSSTGSCTRSRSCPRTSPRREFEVLRHLEDAGLPAVRAVGLAARPERGDAILVTEYLRHSMQYRRLLMRFRRARRRTATGCSTRWRCCSSTSTGAASTGATARSRTRCSGATATGSRPTSSTPRRPRSTRRCPTASAVRPRDPRRERRLRPRRPRGATRAARRTSTRAIEAAESVRARYEAVWSELHDQPELIPGDRQAIRAGCGGSTTSASRWTSRWTRSGRRARCGSGRP